MFRYLEKNPGCLGFLLQHGIPSLHFWRTDATVLPDDLENLTDAFDAVRCCAQGLLDALKRRGALCLALFHGINNVLENVQSL